MALAEGAADILSSLILPSDMLPEVGLSDILSSDIFPSSVLPSLIFPSDILPSLMVPFGVEVCSILSLSAFVEPQAAVPTARAATSRAADTILRVRMGELLGDMGWRRGQVSGGAPT